MLGVMIYRFGSYELDTAKMELRADGGLRPVEPQVFGLLALLVDNRERVVSTDEILEKVWDGRIVSDAAVASRVKSARQVLGDDGKAQRFIRTVHRQGFRFVAPVRVERETAATPADHASRPSIAVLPFRFLGAPCPHATIADALPHELIVDLARLRWLSVTARGSSFRLRGADADAGEIGRLLGVRYCLCGTIELRGTRLAVGVELVDTRDGSVVWAEHFAGALGEVHGFREEIRASILAALEIRIPLHEAALARLVVSENLDAWSAFHLGLQHMYRFNRRDNVAARALFQQAVTLDPGFARAHAGLSFLDFQAAFMGYTDDLGNAIELARGNATRALELDPLEPFAHFAMGRTYWLEGDLEGGLAWLERATNISPNYAQGIYARAWTESLSGRPAQGRAHVDLAMRLSPLDPLHYAMLATRAFTHMARDEHAEAAAWVERAARAPGAHVLIALIAAVVHVLAGDRARADAWAANARARSPDLTRKDFFRAFPATSAAMRDGAATALATLGL